ncbi:MAG: GcrA family cell cycle regulator [Xanthobacteraceae bacterium]
MTSKRASWDGERIAAMKRCLEAGFSCSEIARELGVTRNAVLGKLHRLRLSGPQDIATAQVEQRRAARLARPKTPRPPSRRPWLPKAAQLGITEQQQLLSQAFDASLPPADIAIHEGRGCTLLELGQHRCRWPISSPGLADFCFCGNEPVKGLPYCLGHARLAYRPAGRARAG